MESNMTTETGGPAFPHVADLVQNSPNGGITTKPITSNGMTLRDYFAGKAMLGLIGTEKAEEFVDEDGYEMGNEVGDSGTLFVHTKFLAQEAYMIADMMLVARKK
jgi:hypothetical protein